jgi:diguanylate cyclase (GGDEF)-like protein/PAS domain S-box-containing protein
MRMPRDGKPDPLALRISVLYALLGALWILVSDRVLLALAHDPRQIILLETYKGVGFVLVTAVFIFLLQRHQVRRAVKAEAERGREAARLADVLQVVAQAIIAVDRNERILVFNKAAEETFGCRSEEILGRRLELLVPGHDLRVLRGLISRLADRSGADPQTLKSQEILARRRNGQSFEAEVSISQLEQGGLTLFAIALSDIAERKRAEQALRLSEAQYRGFLEHVPLGVYRSNSEGHLLAVNSELAQMLGFDREADLLALNLGRDLYVDLQDRERCQRKLDAEGELRGVEVRMRRKDGAEIVAVEHSRVVRDANGQILHYEGTLSDITDRIHTEERLRFLGTHDPLTGLYNRSYYEEELLRLRRGRVFPVSVVMADLDGLKDVNDKFGHDEGDALLRETAQILQASFRAEDVVARIGGDEFGILLPSMALEGARQAIERVRARVAERNRGQPRVTLGISMGCGMAGSADALKAALRQADAGMYQKKTAQRESKAARVSEP